MTSSTGPIDISRRKELALLAYLVVKAGQAHSRETLLGLLWPELPEADARNNLRAPLAPLRKTLDDCAAFEEWLFVWRERLHLQATEALADLEQGLENGRFPAATQFTHRLLALDPLHDDPQHRIFSIFYCFPHKLASRSSHS